MNTRQQGFLFPDNLIATLQRYAVVHGKTKTEVVVAAVWEYMETHPFSANEQDLLGELEEMIAKHKEENK
jgi:hypothetical protein